MIIEKFYKRCREELWNAANEHSKNTNNSLDIRSDDASEPMSNFMHQFMNKCLCASNFVLVDGKNGRANTIITNFTVAGLIQMYGSYHFQPVSSTIRRDDSVYLIGNMYGMNLYIDNKMSGQDNHVLVGKFDDTKEIDKNQFISFSVECNNLL